MSCLSIERVLKDKKIRDPNSVTSLSLTHKALSDVSCLTHFNNLGKLDLAFNNLTSLQGLRPCMNLKWLSVVQNKLQSLKGIEALSNLTVLNAGKNKLKSMDEVKSLVSLRALILNDNEIVSISRLDQMKELNTLVLSRNPIHEIGEYLFKVKSITKLSLSNCQLQNIGSSLKLCVELTELRLAHNDIKTLPAELACNAKLLNLDLGNNVITRWSDIKVLGSLVDLENLNLTGNPIAENDKIAKKVQKLLPNLHVFNARPVDKSTQNENSEKVDDLSLVPADAQGGRQEKKKDNTREKESSKQKKNDNAREKELSKSGDLENASDDMEKYLKLKRKKTRGGSLMKEEVPVYEKDGTAFEKKLMKTSHEEHDDANDLDMGKDLKRKRRKTFEKPVKNDVGVHGGDSTTFEKKPKQKKAREELGELEVIDNGEISFADLFAVEAAESPEHGSEKKIVDKAVEDMNLMGCLATIPAKKKKTKKQRLDLTDQLAPAAEFGMGGPSTWSDG